MMVVRSATLSMKEKQEIKESKVNEESKEDSFATDSEEDEEEDFEAFYKKEMLKYRSANAKREFFSGMRFQLRMDSF